MGKRMSVSLPSMSGGIGTMSRSKLTLSPEGRKGALGVMEPQCGRFHNIVLLSLPKSPIHPRTWDSRICLVPTVSSAWLHVLACSGSLEVSGLSVLGWSSKAMLALPEPFPSQRPCPVSLLS